jgi:ankyrin repeat protein
MKADEGGVSGVTGLPCGEPGSRSPTPDLAPSSRTSRSISWKRRFVVVAAAVLAIGVLGRWAVRVRDEDGWTLLHWAAYQGDLSAVRVLLALGADRYAESKDMGFYAGTDIIRRDVLDAWAKRPLRTPADAAISNDQVCALRLLLDTGFRADHRDRLGSTALHTAAEVGDSEVAGLLLDRGGNVNARDEWGWTPLHWAAYRRSDDVMALLLKKGADPDAKSSKRRELSGLAPFWIEAGATPLHAAVYSGDTEVIEALLRAGADVNARDDRGNTPLAYTRRFGPNSAQFRESSGGAAEVLEDHGGRL